MTETLTSSSSLAESRAMTAAVRRWVRRVGLLVLAGIVVGVLVYQVRFAPVAVEAYRVERGDIVAEVFGTGTLEAHVKATISPKIAGRIREVLVDQGDRVTEGQQLFRLENEELAQKVAIAQANLESAQAALQRNQADRERALAVEAQARRDFNRVRSLVSRNVSSQEELDRVSESLAVSVAGLASADAAILMSEKDVVAARENLAYERTRLGDAEVTAPADGLIVSRLRDPGDVVVPGNPVLALIVTDVLWISAWVDETVMAEVSPNQAARVAFRSEPEEPYPGNVVRLGREVDRETREFIVDVQVLELPTNWAVGQRADVFIETGRASSVIVVPNHFLSRNGPTRGVFVNREGRAAWRPVQIGMSGIELSEVREGLSPGETVVRVADPGRVLGAGQRITFP